MTGPSAGVALVRDGRAPGARTHDGEDDPVGRGTGGAGEAGSDDEPGSGTGVVWTEGRWSAGRSSREHPPRAIAAAPTQATPTTAAPIPLPTSAERRVTGVIQEALGARLRDTMPW